MTDAAAADPMGEARAALLEGVLRHAPFDGWTQAALDRAAADAGLDAAVAKRAFPRGMAAVMDAYLVRTDAEMTAALATQDLNSLKIRARIAAAVRTRLELYDRHREAVRRLVTALLAPAGPAGLRARGGMWRTVDLMWRAAGDTATDFNYYTKRGLLLGIYASTLMHWMDDTSEGYADTWAFLDRRIDNVMQIQKVRGRAAAVGETLGALMPLSVLDAIPERLPRIVPMPVRLPLQALGRVARSRQLAQGRKG